MAVESTMVQASYLTPNEENNLKVVAREFGYHLGETKVDLEGFFRGMGQPVQR
jgi:hypothetical protein